MLEADFIGNKTPLIAVVPWHHSFNFAGPTLEIKKITPEFLNPSWTDK
jgi:hypothetical protein